MNSPENIHRRENINFKGDHFDRELLLNVFDEMAYLKNILGKIIRWKKSIKHSPNYGDETTLPQWERFSRKFTLSFQEVNRLTEKVNPDYKTVQRVYKDLLQISLEWEEFAQNTNVLTKLNSEINFQKGTNLFNSILNNFRGLLSNFPLNS